MLMFAVAAALAQAVPEATDTSADEDSTALAQPVQVPTEAEALATEGEEEPASQAEVPPEEAAELIDEWMAEDLARFREEMAERAESDLVFPLGEGTDFIDVEALQAMEEAALLMELQDMGGEGALVDPDAWVLQDLGQRMPRELSREDPTWRRVPLWFGIEIGTIIGARIELSNPQWPVEIAARFGAYTRVESGAALQPTALLATEWGRGFQGVVGVGYTYRDGEAVPIANLGIQRDRRDRPSHLQSGVLLDREGWRGLDVTVCWLW